MPKISKEMEQLVKDNLKALNDSIKDIKETENNTFDVIASTEDVDRDWEIIKTDGWDTENWFKNPVVLINHSYRVESIAWKGLDFYKDEEWRMRLKGVFAPNEAGKLAQQLYNWWFLKAVSVWFIVKQRNETDRLIIEKAELLEVSFVAVPANPEAISMDWKTYKKAVKLWLIKWEQEEEKKEENIDIKELAKEVKEIKEMIVDFWSKVSKIEDEVKKLANKGDDNPKGDDSKTQQDEKLFKEFLQNLSKNASKTLYQLKNKKD